MSASQRTKGHAWEREVARRFAEIYPDAKRGLSQSRGGGECCDVEGTPFHVECKVGKAINLRAAYRQAVEDCTAPEQTSVIVVAKFDREAPLVVIGLEDFVLLVELWETAKGIITRASKHG